MLHKLSCGAFFYLSPMIYRIISYALIAMGGFYIGRFLAHLNDINDHHLFIASLGISTLLIGILNYVYIFETPSSPIPKILLLASNGLFIGFMILLITSKSDDLLPSYITLALVLISSIMVLNKKVS